MYTVANLQSAKDINCIVDMPLPASLFLQRGRSDSMMNELDEQGNASSASSPVIPSPGTVQHSQDDFINNDSDHDAMQAQDDAQGHPMYTPPITMTAFDNSYGPHGLLASAMSSSYDAPHTLGVSHPFNPRASLLRRTSSSSTLNSSEDEEEVEWSAYDVERLTAVYEACVEEASFETPFSGPPPSQLLHAIAKACKRAYKEDWKYSITSTRLKANQIAKEKERLEKFGSSGNENWFFKGFGGAGVAASRRPSVEATPKPPGHTSDGNEMEATPRRKLRRNDSMDFLPESWDLDAVARLSDKLNKTGEDDPHLYHYPYRLRTDTASSGSDNQSCPTRAGQGSGRLLRSMTFTALNSLEDDSSFASSSMAQVPFSPVSHRQDEDCSDGLNNYAQHPLAQSDPSLQLTMQSRRPSLKPGFGAYLTSPRSSSSPHYYHHQKHETNTLYHAPSNISLSSEGPSSSIYSNASLNSSMDTMAISSSSTTSKYDESIYGSSFASSFTTFSGFSALNDRKRSVVWLGDTSSLSGGMVEQNTVSWKHDGPFGLHSASEKTGPSDTSDISSTPSTINEPSGTMDYFSNFTSGPVRDCTASTPKETIPSTISSNTNNTNNNNKRPHPGNINSASKPPLHKSYTFDAISTSPTKKYMRMDENWSSSTTTTHPFVHTTGIGGLDYNYANGIGFSSGSSNGNPGMMLESPFEMDFNGTQNQKGR